MPIIEQTLFVITCAECTIPFKSSDGSVLAHPDHEMMTDYTAYLIRVRGLRRLLCPRCDGPDNRIP